MTRYQAVFALTTILAISAVASAQEPTSNTKPLEGGQRDREGVSQRSDAGVGRDRDDRRDRDGVGPDPYQLKGDKGLLKRMHEELDGKLVEVTASSSRRSRSTTDARQNDRQDEGDHRDRRAAGTERRIQYVPRHPGTRGQVGATAPEPAAADDGHRQPARHPDDGSVQGTVIYRFGDFTPIRALSGFS
jgi:hypothetical protein